MVKQPHIGCGEGCAGKIEGGTGSFMVDAFQGAARRAKQQHGRQKQGDADDDLDEGEGGGEGSFFVGL